MPKNASGFPSVKIVDGFEIRNTLDADFAMIEDHINKSYIPENEIWLEKHYLPEKDFLLKNLLDYRRTGKNFHSRKVPAPELLKKIKRKLLEEKKDLKIYLADGREVRKNLDPDFCVGGHFLVYDYIPKSEVWIDDVLPEKDWKYTLVHELHELELMRKGKSYDNAHEYALAAEKEARRNDGFGKYPKDKI